VYLVVDGKGVMLSNDITLDMATSPAFKQGLGLSSSQVKIYGNDVHIFASNKERLAVLHFSYDDRRLQSVFVGGW